MRPDQAVVPTTVGGTSAGASAMAAARIELTLFTSPTTAERSRIDLHETQNMDLPALFAKVLQPHHKILTVQHFTARVLRTP